MAATVPLHCMRDSYSYDCTCLKMHVMIIMMVIEDEAKW